MELKSYQKDVIKDLARFLELLTEKQNIAAAYRTLWTEKGVNVGVDGMPPYRSNIPGTPEVCFKVPTGGGKTYLAASSIKPIFDSMPNTHTKAVVWLVPSEAILTQTYKALSNPDHDYRRRIDNDFGGRVEVYSKEQLLNGQNFNPTAVTEQLSVFVLSFDSFRTSKKDGRKAYQENGNLASFPRMMPDKSVLLPETDETALIQVVRSLNPLVIVDESHHATSSLSIEMLKNFNPCFVLDLTATPKANSNIISFVDAVQLKRENMVKLPVIVYNRKSQDDVFADAINIRGKLEAQAKIEQESSGRYIRPIVLFQAQPRVGADSTTYDKIKKQLIEMGIPEDQIAIKTGDKDELKSVDLMSPECPIRYIITVNALKEGWDCPFAYVLATVANRTSAVDVEQILGRILRLPHVTKNKSNVLNISYVITSSADFHQTVDSIVKGLNTAGFSRHDCRVQEEIVETVASFEPAREPVQIVLPEPEEATSDASVIDDVPVVDTAAIKTQIEQTIQSDVTITTEDIESDELFADALAQNDEYEAVLTEADDSVFTQAPQEVRDKMNVFHILPEFADEAEGLVIPQFMLKTPPSLFSEFGTELLTLDNLMKGFTLRDKDVQVDFSTVAAEIARIDVDNNGTEPKAWQINGSSADSDFYKEWFNAQPSAIRLASCKGMVRLRMSRYNGIEENDLMKYVDRVVDMMSEDQLSDFEQSPYPYIEKIKAKIESLIAEHRRKVFDLWLEQGKIICQPCYRFPKTISPTEFTSSLPKSLYEAEEDMDKFERAVVWALSSCDNIMWWHRNMSRRGFMINGSTHAYPDIIVMTTSGKILMVEPKGDHLDNPESQEKARIGSKWDSLAGENYRYFMVFKTKSPGYPGAYSFDRFMEIVKEL